MINVDPYLQKLEWLKEWIAYRQHAIWGLMEIFRVYDRTGDLYYGVTASDVYYSFEAFCEHKQSLEP
jgi:hypothetical protein